MGFGAFLKQEIKIFVIQILVFLTFFGCQYENDQKRLYRKKIKYENKMILWFYYSNLSNISPDLLILESSDRIDTICEVNNLKNIKLNNKELTLYFKGTPRLYENNVELPKHINNLVIKVKLD